MTAPTPADVAEAQLKAYNARDIDVFAATFSRDVVGIDMETGAERFRGAAALRERYGAQFRTNPAQRSDVLTRTVVGEYVFDLELISGTIGPDGTPVPEFMIMAVYRVRGGVIDRAWFTPRTSVAGQR